MKIALCVLTFLCVQNMAYGAAVVDLLSPGNSGSIDGVIFQQNTNIAGGTGNIEVFAQIGGGNAGTMPVGYNTNENNTFQNGNPDNFNRTITIDDVPLVLVGGTVYREFTLDINESSGNGAEFLSLDDVRIYLGGDDNPDTETLTDPDLGTEVYHMDANMDNWVAMDFQLGSGSGTADVFMYVPNSLFVSYSGTDKVTLYSEFGKQGVDPANPLGGVFTGDFGASSSSSDWALRQNVAAIPEPSSVLCLLLVGTVVAGCRRWSADRS